MDDFYRPDDQTNSVKTLKETGDDDDDIGCEKDLALQRARHDDKRSTVISVPKDPELKLAAQTKPISVHNMSFSTFVCVKMGLSTFYFQKISPG